MHCDLQLSDWISPYLPANNLQDNAAVLGINAAMITAARSRMADSRRPTMVLWFIIVLLQIKVAKQVEFSAIKAYHIWSTGYAA